MQEVSWPHILFGGDYNPDQYGEKTLQEDMELFKKAHINTVVLPVFSWAKLEPRDGVFEFEWLDTILDTLWDNQIGFILATSTAAQPAWMSLKYPDILPVDIEGRKRTHGMRAFFCINSPSYRRKAKDLATAMALRYKNHPGLVAWHVANEYGTYCYCETCQEEFRKFLKRRYRNIKTLNERWFTSFWGRTVYDFSEVMLPTALNDDYRFNPIIQLDYLRFMTDSTIDCFNNESIALQKICPAIPVYTNISGFIKKIDQFKMIPHMSFAAWDNYPNPHDGPHIVALKHSIMRGALDGRPFIVAEQTPSQQNWQPYNKLKKPGQMRLIAYQGLAQGADGSLFFQMRQSIAGQEKFHGAVISHGGKSDTRVFTEFSRLGEELASLGAAFLGSRIHAKVGLLFDWENWWALELTSGPSKDLQYFDQVTQYYKPFYENNISVDVLKTTSDISGYSVIIAPMLYLIKDGIEQKLIDFVANGGVLIGTYLTGVADENDRCVFGDRPGPLSDVFGLWVEETDALFTHEHNIIVQGDRTYESSFLCDRIHRTTAQAVATYGRDFYAGECCITRNRYGSGEAWYFGTMPEQSYLEEFVVSLAKKYPQIQGFDTPKGVEAVLRVHPDGIQQFLFLINHREVELTVTLPSGAIFEDLLIKKIVEAPTLVLPPFGVSVLRYR